MIRTDTEGYVFDLPSIEDPPETERETPIQTLEHALAKIEEAALIYRKHPEQMVRPLVLQAIDLLLEVDGLMRPAKPDLLPGDLLDEARGALAERARTYGDATPHFKRVAAMWSALLRADVQPHDVPLCMIAIKALRAAESPDHADSWIDLAGYAALGTQAAEVKAP